MAGARCVLFSVFAGCRHYFQLGREDFKAALAGALPSVLTGGTAGANPVSAAEELAGLAAKLAQLEAFSSWLLREFAWCVEPRNPHWLNGAYFGLMRKPGLGHVFQQGYFMPLVYRVHGQFADQMTETVVVRIHGPDRERRDDRSGKDWLRIVEFRDGELNALSRMLGDLRERQRKMWTFANNHYEGCAPLTIQRIRERMAGKS